MPTVGGSYTSELMLKTRKTHTHTHVQAGLVLLRTLRWEKPKPPR